MAKVLNRWVLLALLSAGFGGASIYAGHVVATNRMTEAQRQRWREYASAAQRGERSPSPEQVQALTNSALAGDDAWAAAGEVLTWVGIVTLGIGLILAIRLSRSRIDPA